MTLIKFSSRPQKRGKLMIGIVLFPDDMTALMKGHSERTQLDKLHIDDPVVDAVTLYFFRDEVEWREAMREAGVDPAMLAIGGGQ